MNKVANDVSRPNASLERIAAALRTGIVLLNSGRQVIWMNQQTRSRLNGGAEQFAASLTAGDAPAAVSCIVYTADLNVDGEPATVCVIQENDLQDQGMDFMAAVENALADTSWFRQTIMEKLKALRQIARPAPRTSDLDSLTDREREVLALICEGRSDAEMGAMLKLSQNTIRNHIASLYRKIGVNRRGAAIIWARERAITIQDALGTRRRARPVPAEE